MNLLKRILEALMSSCHDTKTLSRELGVKEEEISAAISILQAHGYIEEAVEVDPCARCPLHKTCSNKPPKTYTITEKGLRMVSKNP